MFFISIDKLRSQCGHVRYPHEQLTWACTINYELRISNYLVNPFEILLILRSGLTVNSEQLSVKYEGETPHQLVKGVGGASLSPTISRQD